MKKLIVGMLLLVCFYGWGQKDTKKISQSIYDISNKIYGDFQKDNKIDYLLNKTLKDTSSLVYITQIKRDSTTDANWFYRVYRELRLMAKDTNQLPNLEQLFTKVNEYRGKKEFQTQTEVYPIGIIDFDYTWLKENEPVQKRLKRQKRIEPFKNNQGRLQLKKKRVQLVAPLFNYSSLDEMGVVFRKENFYSNRHSPNDVKGIIVIQDGKTKEIKFDEIYKFEPQHDMNQTLIFKIFFKNGDSIINKSIIKTPDLIEEGNNINNNLTVTDSPSFKRFHKEQNGKFKLKAYIVPSCSNTKIYTKKSNDPEYIPRKPYIIVSGYRPPLAATGPKNLWKRYNQQHDLLLNQLRKNGYDIILILFNQAAHPQKMGISEKSDLLIQYIEHLNSTKEQYGYSYNENVIQGSSSGNSVIRLALLKMEKKHLHNNNYPHHHCRLFISYDGNYYGANIPLAYQMQIYSGLKYFNALVPGSLFLKFYLHGVLEQKATKQLLTYHAKGMGNEDFFDFPVKHKTWIPTYAYERQDYLNKVNSAYNGLGYYPHGQLFIPIPSSTRNISISLGHYKKSNYNTGQNLDFNSPGEAWRYKNIWLYKSILRAAQYSNGGKLIFKRFLFSFNMWGIPSVVANEELKVKHMQDIDGASGSYLKGVANVLALTNLAYGFNWNNTFSQPKFTHKSVLSALAINKSVWPSNGSHTLNLQSEGLMFNNFNFSQTGASDYYGYPNLGRPNDHWDITPFEAIYCSNHIMPHIDLKKEKDKYIDPINEFIKNEVEPCYLYLQNQHLGEQARSNYTYKSRRRANNVITTGHLVTPKTDPGDYVVEPNADLILEAGKEIDLKPGTHIKAGAKAHLWIHYESCERVPRPCAVQGLMANSIRNYTSSRNYVATNTKKERQGKKQHDGANVKVFPNPTSTKFTVVSTSLPLKRIIIYSMGGKHIKAISSIKSKRYTFKENLPKGIYLLKVQDSKGNYYHKKLIVL